MPSSFQWKEQAPQWRFFYPNTSVVNYHFRTLTLKKVSAANETMWITRLEVGMTFDWTIRTSKGALERICKLGLERESHCSVKWEGTHWVLSSQNFLKLSLSDSSCWLWTNSSLTSGRQGLFLSHPFLSPSLPVGNWWLFTRTFWIAFRCVSFLSVYCHCCSGSSLPHLELDLQQFLAVSSLSALALLLFQCSLHTSYIMLCVV